MALTGCERPVRWVLAPIGLWEPERDHPKIQKGPDPERVPSGPSSQSAAIARRQARNCIVGASSRGGPAE